MLYLVLWNKLRNIIFTGYGSHGNKENRIFVVSMPAVAKGKKSFASFRNIRWTNTPWEFQPKATIISFEKMLQPVPLFPVTRALNPSNGFTTTRKWVKTLWFPNVYMFGIKNSSDLSVFSVLHVWFILVMDGAGPPWLFKSTDSLVIVAKGKK